MYVQVKATKLLKEYLSAMWHATLAFKEISK